MKIDQVAYYCKSSVTEMELKASLGLQNAVWIEDIVKARSVVRGVDGQNIAHLQFNYDLGIELELIQYQDGNHWHKSNPSYRLYDGFASHTGVHLEDNEAFPDFKNLVQETWTISHTSEYLTKPDSPGFMRHYHYRIHEIAPGTYIKFIKRIPPT